MEYTVYKPNRKQTGGAIKFNVHKTGKFSFMKAAPQIGAMGESKMFGWEDNQAINVKMGFADLGAFLAVFTGKKTEVKLFHKTENDNKIIDLKHDSSRGGFGLSVSHQIKGVEQKNQVFIGLSYEESEVLRVYVENTIREMLEASVWSGEQ